MDKENYDHVAICILILLIIITCIVIIKMPSIKSNYYSTTMEDIVSVEKIECKVIDKLHIGFYSTYSEEYLKLDNGMLVPISPKEYKGYSIGKTYTFELVTTQTLKIKPVNTQN